MSVSYCEWELIDSGSIQHNYNVLKALPGTNAQKAAFGPEYIVDLEKPECTYTFQADNISKAALVPLQRAGMGRNVLVTLADKSGQTYTGRISSLSWEAIPGSSLYKAALQLRSCQNEGDLGVQYTNVSLTDFNDAANRGSRAHAIIDSANLILSAAGAENV
ncbi:hypothetical protein IJT93_07735 [bacterium]|nr:hypothetical protein [bacterium]